MLLTNALLVSGARHVGKFKLSRSELTKKRATAITIEVARFIEKHYYYSYSVGSGLANILVALFSSAALLLLF